MTAIVVIPARFGSTRYPGKPLARETGKTLIQHVVERAHQAARVAAVVVATDDARIWEAVRGFGGTAVMTREDHASGTDRIAEVMGRPEYTDVGVVVNVQGDEPEMAPEVIDALIEAVEEGAGGTGAEMATASAPFGPGEDVTNPNVVKVVTDEAGYALYFSRAAIPYDRDAAGVMAAGRYRKHLGIYAYRRETLLELATAPACELERIEKLEQLRALWMGVKIMVREAAQAPHGIDTPADYAEFVRRYNGTDQMAQSGGRRG